MLVASMPGPRRNPTHARQCEASLPNAATRNCARRQRGKASRGRSGNGMDVQLPEVKPNQVT
jgi:hypothetical protein